ncbi:hypothetical protein WKI68_00630 [Streptomyces sp. MS1.HAVA.3]|uniref:Uncharacterized protein n=1 Tax=Streptomyces caledonius TaxID=3134107 RepID=A0ABU8TXJ2_9ACTN
MGLGAAVRLARRRRIRDRRPGPAGRRHRRRGLDAGACAAAALIWLTRDYLGNLEAVAGRGPLLLGLFFVLAVYTLPRGLAGVRLPHKPTRKRTA